MSRDPRLTLARADLAARSLEGVMRAPQFVEATIMQAVVPVAALRIAPDDDAEQADQILFGEIFEVAEIVGPFAWGQARRDGYVGFVQAAALSPEVLAPTHWVCVPRTFAFAEPAIRSRPFGPLSLNALITITEEGETMARAAGAGWIARRHLAPIGQILPDPAAVAEGLIGAPYLWGGRDSVGLDCSGLVQQALYAGGLACPRDADQQAMLGEEVSPDGLARGDLVFWRGHAGMMLDGERLLHANGHHMAVTIEPLAGAISRIAAGVAGRPTAFRRLTYPPAALAGASPAAPVAG